MSKWLDRLLAMQAGPDAVSQHEGEAKGPNSRNLRMCKVRELVTSRAHELMDCATV